MARINPGMMMIDGGYEPLVAVIAQAVAASPVVVDTPANVTPSTTAALKVAEQVAAVVAPIIAPDVSDSKLSQIAKQVTNVVVKSPEVIAAPAGQTINTTTLQGIIASSVKMPYDTTKPATTVTMPYDGTTTPSVKNLDTTTLEGIKAASTTTPASTGKPVTGGIMLDNYNPATGVTTASPVVDPKVTPYTELTAAQRAAMTQKEKTDYLQAAREFEMANEAKARAATDPLKNYGVRPTAPTPKPGMINYYSWVGGVNSGSWKLYQAVDNPENQAKYGARSFGGPTTAGQTNNAEDANTLVTPPVYNPSTGKYTPSTTTTPITTAVTTTPITSAVTTTPVTSSVTTMPVTSAVTATVTTDANTALIKQLQDQINSLKNQSTAAANIAAANATKQAESQRQSIIATLTDRFNKYGLSSLVTKIRDLAVDGATEATITLALQETPEYQQRFAANTERLKKNLQVLTPAEYLNLEDGYRQVLRAYGLKQFDTDEYVRQFISNDVSAAELSDRVVTAVQRVQNADPAVSRQLRDYYGIGNTDLVAYVLDPNQQLPKIQRQVAAAEIGAAAAVQGITPGVTVAEQLAAQGVTQAEARKGYSTIADILPTAEKLSAIYGGVEAGYGLGEAEQEVFNSLAEAQRKRERLTSREIASFSGRSGIARTGLTQSTQGQF